MDGIIALKKAKSYIEESLLGAGAIVGKNVVVSKIEPIVDGNRVTFTYTLDNGTQKNSYLDVMNGKQGISVVSAKVDNSGILSFKLSNDEIISAGKIMINMDNMNLDDLIAQKITENFVPITYEEINDMFAN